MLEEKWHITEIQIQVNISTNILQNNIKGKNTTVFFVYVFEFGEMVSFSEHLISVPKPVTDLDRSPSHKQESAGLHSHLLVKSKQVIVGKNIWTHILKHV